MDRLETEQRVLELQIRLLATLEARLESAPAADLEEASRELRESTLDLAALYNDYAAKFQVGGALK